MAREDTRWFVVGVVTLSFVIFLALPIAALIVIDHLRIRSEVRQERREIRQEIGELKKLKQQLKKDHHERSIDSLDDATKRNSD
jgi:hypothetical protein